MQKFTGIMFSVAASLLVMACGAEQEASSPHTDAREVADKLTEVHAIARKARVSGLSYKLDMDLISNPDAYQGTVDVAFMLSGSDQPLTIDFTGGSVSAVTVNGDAVDVNYSGFFITLPAHALEDGANVVSISYAHPYDQDGTGLHRFVDPEDGNTYLYTYLWPYYANRLFPNFDQPNLKGTYELTVRAAKDWQVVSSTMEETVVEDGEAKVWHFPRSEKFSSYIFSLHAGPYKVWSDMAGEVPIRLMARQSLAPHVAVEEWFDFTKMGLEHFKNYFDIPYPFHKYDQVIVPDFNIGAMENVAAVTFAESYVQRGPSSRFQRQRRAGTILHEMAHMWFGDLVTKDWWNGLWLNESFATLMSSIAVSNLPEFQDLWHDFYLGTNLRAIAADNMVSTHPIEGPVPSTNDFFAVFDAITYQKGASVLNQLSHYMGKEEFRLGVSSYLKKHSWGNTTLSDFIGALSAQSGQDLTPWADEWLYKAGVNTIKAGYVCKEGKISDFTISQTAPEDYPTLRSQKTQLALFAKNDAGKIEPYNVMAVTISGAETKIPDMVGAACPLIAYPNYQGWGFAEVDLDATSLENLKGNMKNVDDPLLRSMFWTALLNAPDTGDMGRGELFQALADNMVIEGNDRIINQLLNAMVGGLNRLERLGEAGQADLATYGPILEDRLWSLITGGDSTTSIRMIRLGQYINMVRSDRALNNLKGLLDGSLTLPDLPIRQGHRWNVIQRLAQRGVVEAPALLAAEKMTDPSDRGKRSAMSVEAALPDLAIKQQWLATFMEDENPLPLSNQRAAMTSLFPSNQGALQEQLLGQMIEALPHMAEARDHYYQRSYASSLFAGICTAEGLSKMSGALDKAVIGTTQYRFLSENIQRAEKCVTAKGRE